MCTDETINMCCVGTTAMPGFDNLTTKAMSCQSFSKLALDEFPTNVDVGSP